MLGKLFRRSAQLPPAQRSFKPRLEVLEGREVPAAGGFLAPLGAELTQLGTDLSHLQLGAVFNDLNTIQQTLVSLLPQLTAIAQGQFNGSGQFQFGAMGQGQFSGSFQSSGMFQGMGSFQTSGQFPNPASFFTPPAFGTFPFNF